MGKAGKKAEQVVFGSQKRLSSVANMVERMEQTGQSAPSQRANVVVVGTTVSNVLLRTTSNCRFPKQRHICPTQIMPILMIHVPYSNPSKLRHHLRIAGPKSKINCCSTGITARQHRYPRSFPIASYSLRPTEMASSELPELSELSPESTATMLPITSGAFPPSAAFPPLSPFALRMSRSPNCPPSSPSSPGGRSAKCWTHSWHSSSSLRDEETA